MTTVKTLVIATAVTAVLAGAANDAQARCTWCGVAAGVGAGLLLGGALAPRYAPPQYYAPQPYYPQQPYYPPQQPRYAPVPQSQKPRRKARLCPSMRPISFLLATLAALILGMKVPRTWPQLMLPTTRVNGSSSIPSPMAG